jgi:hypothetical protein
MVNKSKTELRIGLTDALTIITLALASNRLRIEELERRRI